MYDVLAYLYWRWKQCMTYWPICIRTIATSN